MEVSDEVAECLYRMYRDEANRRNKIWYYKAYYTLDADNGIEKAFLEYVPSPEDLYMKGEEERLKKIRNERLQLAVENLSAKQARRLTARYTFSKKLREIAVEEGVSVVSIKKSIDGAVQSIRRQFDQNHWLEEA